MVLLAVAGGKVTRLGGPDFGLLVSKDSLFKTSVVDVPRQIKPMTKMASLVNRRVQLDLDRPYHPNSLLDIPKDSH